MRPLKANGLGHVPLIMYYSKNDAHNEPPSNQPGAPDALAGTPEVLAELRELTGELRNVADRLGGFTEAVASDRTPLHTVESAAAYLSVSVRKVWSLIAAGELTPIVIGERSTRISDTNLKAYVRRCVASGGARK